MRVWMIGLLLLLAGGSASAQLDRPGDSLKYGPVLLTVDLNYDRLLDAPSGMNQDWWSRGISIAAQYDVPLFAGLSLAPGVGFSSQNYFSNSDVVRSTDSITGLMSSTFEQFPDGSGVKRNKISTNFIDVPIELRWRSEDNTVSEAWMVAIGFKAGYLVNVHTKTVTGEGKVKGHIFPDINEVHYGPTFRFGYGRFGLSAFYGLSTFFEEGKGPEMNSFSAGIYLMPY